MGVALGNFVISRSNHDIPFTSELTAAILIFVGVASHFLVLKNLVKIVKKPIVLTRKVSQAFILYLIYSIYPNSPKDMSKHVSLITISSTLVSQLTSKVIPLKLLNPSMTTSSKL